MTISFSLRAFAVYFVILAGLSWFILDEAIERINIALRQSAETVLVDTANLMATALEHEFRDDLLDTGSIERLFSDAYARKLNAQIYSILKNRIDTGIYITDRAGMVVYDSSGEHTGEDFSQWRDVRLTLEGEYGARSSFRFEDRTEETDPKIMVIAAPILHQNQIVGVVSVVKPTGPLEEFLSSQSTKLKQYAYGLLLLAIGFGFLISHWFTRAIERLVSYANGMASGNRLSAPKFTDKRFNTLATAMTNMRQQIDGKNYVEEYIHSLTHELKTPITSIQASAEILEGDPEPDQKQRFLQNIQGANRRMSLLVDRMLELARIEGKVDIQRFEAVKVAVIAGQLIAERQSAIDAKQLIVTLSDEANTAVKGDPLLIEQAIANLLDNALAYCPAEGAVCIFSAIQDGNYRISVANDGAPLETLVLEKAFDRFFSLPPADSDRKSTGLGLSFVKEIMTLHQGRASLENTENGIVASIAWPVV